MNWQIALIIAGLAFAAVCFLLSDSPRRMQHRRRWPREQHHSYFASCRRDYAE